MQNDFSNVEKSLNTNNVEANSFINEKLKLINQDKKKYHEYVRKAVEAWDEHNEKKKDES